MRKDYDNFAYTIKFYLKSEIKMRLKLTVIIPTYNEELNIRSAILSVANYVDQILIADSFSSDNTCKLAEDLSKHVNVVSIGFTTFAEKMNKAILSAVIRNDWVMRLDADEFVVDPENFFKQLDEKLHASSQAVVGFYVRRQYHFLGKFIRYGGMYPRYVMRVFNKNSAIYESKSVDEKVILDGKSDLMEIDIADSCRKGFNSWVKKHIRYAQREADDVNNFYGTTCAYDLEFDNLTHESKLRYYSWPLFLRPIVYFFYRFFLQSGYKDGPVGWLYHFLHAFIYRELVDIYILKNKLLKSTTKKNS